MLQFYKNRISVNTYILDNYGWKINILIYKTDRKR